jgi:transcriptional regulator with XRE-family HTH domain
LVISIGKRIRSLRKQKGLLLIDLAVKLNVLKSSISQWENNKRVPDVTRIKEIAEFFNVSTDYIIGLTDVEYNPKDKQLQDILKIYESMNSEKKKEIVDLIKSLYKER